MIENMNFSFKKEKSIFPLALCSWSRSFYLFLLNEIRDLILLYVDVDLYKYHELFCYFSFFVRRMRVRKITNRFSHIFFG